MPESSKHQPTIREVAERAGVSHQTVSRYVRNQSGMKPTTVSRVEAAVAELGYVPNLSARSMRTRRSGVVAVLLPGWIGHLAEELTAACAVARSAGYRVEVIVAEGGVRDRGERARQLLTGGQVEGLLSLAPLDIDMAGTHGALAVSPDFDDDMRNIGALADGSTAGEIVRCLTAMGHRHFLHIAGDASYASARNRVRAYLRAIAEEQAVSHGVVGHGWSPEVGYEALLSLSDESEVTAIVAASDEIAIGVLRAAQERGWQVPDRVSVFGWDDLKITRYATPSLSTVRVSRHAHGTHAMQRLIAAIRGEPVPTMTGKLNDLILRESTGPARAG